MSEFATEFGVDSKRTIQDLCDLFCKWITGIRDTAFLKGNLSIDADLNPFFSVSMGNESVSMRRVSDDDYDLIGLSYSNVDIENITWVSEIVGRKDLNKFLVSIRVYRHSSTLIHSIPNPKRPHIIKMLIAGDWSPRDGDIPLLSRSHTTRESEYQIVSDFLDCKFQNSLPIVYVSLYHANQIRYSVDPNLLAYRLGGIAHVIAESSIAFSKKMKSIFGGHMVFDGAIGIYWPNESRVSEYNKDNDSGKRLLLKITSEVMIALAGRRSNPELAFQYVQELYSKSVINKLRNAGSSNVDEYIRNFDAEISAKDKRLEAAEAEIQRLKSVEKSQYAKEKNKSPSIEIAIPQEKELYDGEFYEFILNSIELSRRNCDKNYRRYHVMEGLLSSNKSRDLHVNLKNSLKEIFHDYSGMDGRIEKHLRDLGFIITDSGKHIKLVFMNDKRYQFAIPKTPSDYRGAQNTISDIVKTLVG